MMSAARSGIAVGKVRGAVALIAAALMLMACSDDAPPEVEARAPAETSAEPNSTYKIEWLRATDAIGPDEWLASRDAKRNVKASDPAVGNMRKVLDVAAMRFRDHPRMIANRAVQLQTMLHEKGIEETAPRLIVMLSQVPGSARHVESFGSISQQYYNLRMEGLPRARAMDSLKQQFAQNH